MIGPNRVAITPNINNAANMIVMEWSQKPTTATAATRGLGKLDPLRHEGLVETVGHLAAETGQKEERCDEDGGCQRAQCFAIGDAGRKQDQEDQRVLQEIVVERGEELAPEQGREAPRRHQRGGHGVRIPV